MRECIDSCHVNKIISNAIRFFCLNNKLCYRHYFSRCGVSNDLLLFSEEALRDLRLNDRSGMLSFATHLIVYFFLFCS